MKAIFSIIISGALVISGFGQTRNVLVGTNNAVVQPTNFWSADASNARVGLGLGPTNNAELNRVIVGNGSFPNPAIQVGTNAKGITGVGSGLFLVSGGNATVGVSSTTLSVNGDITTTQPAATRTNFGLVWEGITNADASSFRTALGLGTAATNPASAFQASSANLTNLAANNGGSLTNLQATSLVGVIPSSNIATVNFSNLAGTLSIASGGTGATNAANARQNLGSTTVGDAVFIATNAAAARTVLGALSTSGDAINLTNFPTLLLRTNGNGAGLTNLTAANITGTVGLASNVTGTIAISNGGSGATTAGGARTNLGLGATWLTNTNVTNFRTAIGLGASDTVFFNGLTVSGAGIEASGILLSGSNGVLAFEEESAKAQTRTNLGLGWSALTNTTASGFQTALFGTGTNPVLVNTNGEVVSPTNFWQAAPINTVLQNITNVVGNATNAATNARMLFLYSLAPTVTNVTSTITLPTNGTTFGGDVATITHLGPTSSVTAIRALGASTNIITLNQIEESVRFIYRDNQWKLMDNISYMEPIFFSGTNAAANAAASRTNLGLGATWLTNNNVTNFRTAIGLGENDTPTFSSLSLDSGQIDLDPAETLGQQLTGFTVTTNSVVFSIAAATFLEATTNSWVIHRAPTYSSTNIREQTRDNLLLGSTNIVTFAGLTNNGDITINQTATNNGLLYIYRTNNEPFLGLANLIASNNTTISNETLFRVGVSEATNKAAQFGFRSTNTNGNGVAVFSVFGYNALMMVGPSDPAAGTNPIEATVYSISPTNKVMTLISTNTAAMQMHRSLGFDTNLSSVGNTNLVPATNNQISKWLRVYIGTNTFYLPLYQ